MNLSELLISIEDNKTENSDKKYDQFLEAYCDQLADRHPETHINSQDSFYAALKSILVAEPKHLHLLIYEIPFVYQRSDIANKLLAVFGIHSFISASLEHKHLIVQKKSILFQYLKTISFHGFRDSRYIVLLNLYVQLFPPTYNKYFDVKDLYPDWSAYVNLSISSSVQKHLRELVRWSIIAIGIADDKMVFFKSFSSLDHRAISATSFSRIVWDILLTEASSGQGQGFFAPFIGSIPNLLASANKKPINGCTSINIDFNISSEPKLGLTTLKNIRVKKIKNHEKWLSEPLSDSVLSIEEQNRLDEVHIYLVRLIFDELPAQTIVNLCFSEVDKYQSIYYSLKIFDLFMLFTQPFLHDEHIRTCASNFANKISSELILLESSSEDHKFDLCKFFLFAARSLQYTSSCCKVIEYIYSRLSSEKLGDFTIGFRGDAFSLSRSHLHLIHSIEYDPLAKARSNLTNFLSSGVCTAKYSIIVFCSQDYIALFDIWVTSIDIINSSISSQNVEIVVFCLDIVAREYLFKTYKNLPAIHFVDYFIISGNYDTYTILFRERLYILNDFVLAGYNTLLCGLDTFISDIDSLLLLLKEYSLVTASDSDIINADCLYLKSNDSTKIFLSRALLYAKAGLIDQTAFNLALKDFVDVNPIRKALSSFHSCVKVNFHSQSSDHFPFYINALFMGRSMATRSHLFLSKDTLIFQPHIRHLNGPKKAEYMQALLKSENANHEYKELVLSEEI